MENNNYCNDCYFFQPYYTKDDNGVFHKMYAGHCTNTRIKVAQFRRSINHGATCSCWKSAEQPEPQESITDIIKNMATRIEQIATHLNIEKN